MKFDSLLLSLVLNIGILVLAATAIVEFKPLQKVIKPYDNTLTGQLVIGAIFGILAISSTYLGIDINDAIVNTRVVSVSAAGLLGGVGSGALAGIIGGVHRYLYNPSSFTAFGCCVGTISFGIVGGLANKRFRNWVDNPVFIALIVIISELIQVFWLFVLARPISAVIELEQIILLPKIAVNSFGLIIFFSTVHRLKQPMVDHMIEGQAQSLLIANNCLPYLRDGLHNKENLQIVADIIRRGTAGYRVMISDCQQILVTSGIKPSSLELTHFMKDCIECGETTKSRTVIERGVLALYRQDDMVVAPLKSNNTVIGTITLIIDQAGLRIADYDAHFAETLTQFFSTILELNNLEREIELRHMAELRAFQSQINPHFFFNALNTISALCRTNPDKARSLLLVLAEYYRQTLSINEEFVPMSAELRNVENYIEIAMARFVDAIHIETEIDPSTKDSILPPLIIQPIVENAIRHGGIAVDNRVVKLKISRVSDMITVTVSDKGHGFPDEIISELNSHQCKKYSGMFNVHKRLVSIYGWDSRLRVVSNASGSIVSFTIPANPSTQIISSSTSKIGGMACCE